MQRRWWVVAVVVAVLVPTAVVLAVWQTGGSRSGSQEATKPVLVGSIALNTTTPQPGAAVIATITLRADRALKLDGLVLAVRDARGNAADAAGRGYDFPDAGPVELSTKSRTLTVAHQFFGRGTYVYFLRYRAGAKWQELPPYQTFTVG